MKGVDFEVFNNKVEGVSDKFDLNSPEGRAKYFQAKAGPEIEKLKKFGCLVWLEKFGSRENR